MQKAFSFAIHASFCCVKACFLMLLALIPQAAVAQLVGSDTITGKIHQIDEVVVSATQQRKVRSTAPVLVVDRAQILSQGITDLSDALRRFSGVNVRDYGGAGGIKTVSVRSLGSQHTAVAYDGVTITDAQSGQIDLSRFTLDNIRSVSLAIGDNDDIFMPARSVASAAILRLQTEAPDFSQRDHRLRAELKVGSFGMLNPYVRYDQKLGQRASLSLNGDYLRADNHYPFRLVNGKFVSTEKRQNNQIETYRAEANLRVRTSENASLSTKVYYYNSFRQLPGPVIFYNSDSREKERDRNFFAQSHYQALLGSKWHLQLNGKFNWSYTHYHDSGNHYPNGRLDNYYYQREAYASGALMYTPATEWAFAYAADYAYNNLSSNTSSGAKPYRHVVLQTLTGKYQTAHVHIMARVLSSVYQNGARRGESAKDAQRLSPSFAVSWKPFDSQEFYVRADYKDIFRVATFSECYYDRFGSRTLKPEIARQVNVGVTYASAKPFGALERLSFSVDGYYNRVKDKLVAKPYNMFFWTVVNLDRVDISGLDVSADADVRLAAKHKLSVNASYTYQKAVSKTDRSSSFYNNQIPYTPRHSGSGSVAWLNPWLNLSLHATASGERYTVEQNIPAYRLGGYVEYGLSAYRGLRLWGCDTQWRFDAINLGDKQYSIVKSYPMPGRHVKLTMSINL